MSRAPGDRILALLLLMSGLSARADYSNTVMSFNPVAYWPLSERPSGPVAVNEGSDPDLKVYYSGSITSAVAGAIVAETNTAASLDGSTAYLIAPFDPALSLRGPFSIEGWFRPASAFPGCICSCGGFGAKRSGWVIYYEPFHGWNFRLHSHNSPAPSLSIEGGDTSVGVWHHVVAVYDGMNGCLYVDGSLAAGPAPVKEFMPNQDGAFTIGTRNDNLMPFAGGVDEVAVYTNALPASVIHGHHENGTNRSPSEPYASLIRAEHPLLYCRLEDPIPSSPPATIATSAINYGSLGAAANGTYMLGARPGSPGPPHTGFGPRSFACKFYPNFGGYVDCLSDARLNITGPMTATAWVKATPGVNRFQTFLGRANLSWRADVDWFGILRWADGNDNPDATGVTAVNDDYWHFFAGAYDGGTNYVYVDGKLQGVVAAPSRIVGCRCKTIIGSVGDYLTDRAFAGSVAQVAIYTNALSAAEILRLYQSAEPNPPIRK
jgi:hypothetical protein